MQLLIDASAVRSAATTLRQAASTASAASGLPDAAAGVLVDAVRREAPARSGRLRASIVARGSGAERGVWGIGYGQDVARGTRPHLIRPRQAQALVFRVGGRTIFARLVQHPGAPPNDFPRRAVVAASPALRLLLRAAARRVIGNEEGSA